MECERYLISVIDEKNTEDKGLSSGQARQEVVSNRARNDYPGSTWRKRKRDFSVRINSALVCLCFI